MTNKRWKLGALALGCAACLSLADVTPSVAHGDKQHEEEHLTLDQLPAAVRATAEKEAAGAKIIEVERERDKKSGKVTYEIEFKRGADTIEVKIAENGSVISREVEQD